MELSNYLSHILDFKIPEGKNRLFHHIKLLDFLIIMIKTIQPNYDYISGKDDQCFILSTDGDVKFTYESVETLIDQICEDGIRYLTMLQAIGFKRFVLSLELDEYDNHIQSILS